MVSIKFKFSNKTFYTILVIAMLLVISGFVYAYTSIPNPGHGADSVQVSINGEEMTLQQAIDQSKLGGSATTYSCHWEKSWKTYPTEGADIAEKTSCNVGSCQFKTDSTNCDPSSASCTNGMDSQACGRTSSGNDEYLYCCS